MVFKGTPCSTVLPCILQPTGHDTLLICPERRSCTTLALCQIIASFHSSQISRTRSSVFLMVQRPPIVLFPDLYHVGFSYPTRERSGCVRVPWLGVNVSWGSGGSGCGGEQQQGQQGQGQAQGQGQGQGQAQGQGQGTVVERQSGGGRRLRADGDSGGSDGGGSQGGTTVAVDAPGTTTTTTTDQGGSTTTVTAPGTAVVNQGDATVVTAPGTTAVSQDGSTVVQAPLTTVDNSDQGVGTRWWLGVAKEDHLAWHYVGWGRWGNTGCLTLLGNIVQGNLQCVCDRTFD